MTFRRNAKQALDLLFRPLGLQISRLPPDSKSRSYYQPPPTCQVETLGTLYELFFGQVEHGFFVEVGAYDGYFASNTSCLADRGWSGVLIEPIPEYADHCRRRYSGRPDIEVVQLAAGAHHGTVSMHVSGPLTTANRSLLAEYRETSWSKQLTGGNLALSVQQSPLDDILASRAVDPGFDLLVVDVEGYEGEVFDGFSVERWQPKMMIVELADTHPDLVVSRESDAALSREIQDADYRIIYKDSINTIFARDDLVRSTLA